MFKGVSVFLGVMATFGSAGVVNHLVSGLVIVYQMQGVPRQLAVEACRLAAHKLSIQTKFVERSESL